MKKQVMLKMWSIRHMFSSIRQALKAAWKLVKLRIAMKAGQVAFKFRKVDGSIREAIGTLQVEYTAKGNSTATEETMSFFDVEANHWKSFKITNFI